MANDSNMPPTGTSNHIFSDMVVLSSFMRIPLVQFRLLRLASGIDVDGFGHHFRQKVKAAWHETK